MVSKYNRPFLVITHIKTVKPGIRTGITGWMTEDSFDVHEDMVIVDRLKPRMTSHASIILDILGEKVVKNRYDVTNAELYTQYIEKYLEDVQEGMIAWARKNPENIEALMDWAQQYAPEAFNSAVNESLGEVGEVIEATFVAPEEQVAEESFANVTETLEATFEEVSEVESNEGH